MTVPPSDQPSGSAPWSQPDPAAPPADAPAPAAGLPAPGASPWDAQPPPGGAPPAPYGAPGPGYVYRPPVPTNLSSAGKRFGAFLLEIVLGIVTLLIGWLIWDLIVWKDGRSPAKQVLKMRIVSQETGQPITWGTSFLRNFVCYGLIGAIPLLGLIYRIVGACFVFNDDRQALWDRMAKTYVIDEA